MTSTNASTGKTNRPSRATRAAAQNAKPAAASKPSTSTSARSSSSKPASDKPARVLDADAAAARAELLATRTAAATDALAIPAGYVLHWAYPAGHSRLSRSDAAPADAPKWLARCDEHGTTKPATDAKSARALGSRARRAEWCKPCARAVAAKAKATSKSTTSDASSTN
jgi:hypothetical protein